MKNKNITIKNILLGVLTGFVNGLFGAGGGLIAVELFKSTGEKQKNAHATSIAIILPLCVVSAIIYAINGNIDFTLGLKLIPFGLLGSLIGTFIMKRISPLWLKRIFSLFLIYAGIRLIFGG